MLLVGPATNLTYQLSIYPSHQPETAKIHSLSGPGVSQVVCISNIKPGTNYSVSASVTKEGNTGQPSLITFISSSDTTTTQPHARAEDGGSQESTTPTTTTTTEQATTESPTTTQQSTTTTQQTTTAALAVPDLVSLSLINTTDTRVCVELIAPRAGADLSFPVTLYKSAQPDRLDLNDSVPGSDQNNLHTICIGGIIPGTNYTFTSATMYQGKQGKTLKISFISQEITTPQPTIMITSTEQSSTTQQPTTTESATTTTDPATTTAEATTTTTEPATTAEAKTTTTAEPTTTTEATTVSVSATTEATTAPTESTNTIATTPFPTLPLPTASFTTQDTTTGTFETVTQAPGESQFIQLIEVDPTVACVKINNSQSADSYMVILDEVNQPSDSGSSENFEDVKATSPFTYKCFYDLTPGTEYMPSVIPKKNGSAVNQPQNTNFTTKLAPVVKPVIYEQTNDTRNWQKSYYNWRDSTMNTWFGELSSYMSELAPQAGLAPNSTKCPKPYKPTCKTKPVTFIDYNQCLFLVCKDQPTVGNVTAADVTSWEAEMNIFNNYLMPMWKQLFSSYKNTKKSDGAP
ncbi:uncharacterized protein LOC113474589 isoform X2 [Ciona intestinalis]